MAEQHRFNADAAFRLHNYQQSIDSYSRSLSLEHNLIAYMNRAKAYFKLNKFDTAIEDCSQVLTMDSKYTQGK